MQKGDYEKASEHFKTANARDFYSEAYWETRNIWLQKNVRSIFVFLASAVVILLVLRWAVRKFGLLRLPVRLHKWLLKYRTYYDLSRIGFMMRHPIDNVYDISKRITGGWLSALLIYVLVFVLMILFQTKSGFLYSVSQYRFSLMNNALLYFGGLALFITSNYYISSIHDGEGTLKGIFVSTAYSLSPLIYTLPPVIILANFATYNESYIISTITGVAVAVCVVFAVLSLVGIHNYSGRETFYNILLTLFFMAVIIFALSIAYLLLKQIIDFLVSIFVEVNLRA